LANCFAAKRTPRIIFGAYSLVVLHVDRVAPPEGQFGNLPANKERTHEKVRPLKDPPRSSLRNSIAVSPKCPPAFRWLVISFCAALVDWLLWLRKWAEASRFRVAVAFIASWPRVDEHPEQELSFAMCWNRPSQRLRKPAAEGELDDECRTDRRFAFASAADGNAAWLAPAGHRY